jgi:N-acetylglucosaminyl-diphospho-decaprenol L-rhamnosyltransferase
MSSPEGARRQDDEAPCAVIIVVAFNSKRHCARQRAALEAQTEKRWRLIVVDNSTAPEQRIGAEDLPAGALLITPARNIGFAAANNLAAANAHAPFLALINPDAFPEPDWLEQSLAAAARHPGFAAYGATQLCDDEAALLDGACDEMHALGLPYRALFRRARALNPSEGETFSACAAATLYRNEDFRAAGGFDESFFCYCEDIDLGYRLRLAGRPSFHASGAVVRHVGGGAGGGRNSFARYHGFRNRLWCFVKATPPLLLWSLAPLHAAASIANALAVSIAERDAAPWRGLIDGAAGLPRIWRARKRIQQARRASTWEIARALVWSPWSLLRRLPKRRRRG